MLFGYDLKFGDRKRHRLCVGKVKLVVELPKLGQSTCYSGQINQLFDITE